MLCDDCKKRPACVHITKISNHKKVDKYLCERCAAASGELSFSNEHNFSVHDFLKGMFSNNVPDASQLQEQACSNCGMTYRDFSRTGKIGCSMCYSVFGSKLEPLLRRIHGASTHIGKIPKRSEGLLDMRRQIKALREKLEQFVVQEEYEQAAVLRDEIRQLERMMDEKKQQEEKL